MILLARHAACEGLGARLNGRADGVKLSPQGRAEALRLARRVATFAPSRVVTSPRERCVQTAEAIATECRAPMELDDDLDEVDFGAWTGLAFAELDGDPAWREWNERRGAARAPGGEDMRAVQVRMRRALARAANRGGAVALISHAEPIRAALADVLGFSLDGWARLDISTAGLTRLDGDPLRVCCINETAF